MAAIIPLRRAPVRDATPISDDALIEAMAAGDREALGLLFDRYHRDIYGFVGSAVAIDVADLDDVVQETFLAAFKAAGRFQHRSSVKTWLFGIGLNLARNHARARRVRQHTSDGLEDYAGLSVAPDADVDARQQLARLADGLAMLPADLRAAYVTCVIENIPGEEAARILDVRKGTLWRRVHEARELLRLHIGRPAR